MNNIYDGTHNIASHESTGTDNHINSYNDPRYIRKPEEDANFLAYVLNAHANHISSKRAMELLAPPKG